MSIKLPTVSVCCIAYNHEAYLEQAIESVLMQQTDFNVEMVIGEDCSLDNTRSIAQEYERLYPGRVRVLAHPQNLGIMSNLMATRTACQGEFIAFLEGDDYWTDSTKLQRQVDALRATTDCAMCFHDAELLYEVSTDASNSAVSERAASFSEIFSHILPKAEVDASPIAFTQADLARLGWFMPSASMLFQASSLPLPLPTWFAGVFSGDYTLQLLSTNCGSALYLPRQMAMYRIHSSGVMQALHNTLSQNERRIWEAEHYCRNFNSSLVSYFRPYLEHLYFERSEKLGANGKRAQQLYYYSKAISISPQRFYYHMKRLVQRVIRRLKPLAN